MDKEPRKATDVLLDLELKIDNLINLIKSQDLNIKLLSNKLNMLLEKPEQTSKITVEAIGAYSNNLETPDEKPMKVSSDFNMGIENQPVGFRRTSRPETYSGDNDYLEKDIKVFPVQVPKIPEAEIIVNTEKPLNNIKESSTKNSLEASSPTINNGVPVIQRVVDKNGKSVFLADVEINDSNGKLVSKTRTNGTGKWMASLAVGTYKIIIKKRESMTKEKLESIQTIDVTGAQTPFELQTLIIK